MRCCTVSLKQVCRVSIGDGMNDLVCNVMALYSNVYIGRRRTRKVRECNLDCTLSPNTDV
jgi:hypothetical protein